MQKPVNTIPSAEHNTLNPVIFLCVASFVLIFGSLFFPILIYPCLVIAAIYILLSSSRNIFCFLLFFFSYAVIFKPHAGGTSFFTYIELIAIISIFMQIKSIGKEIILFLLFFCFILLNTGLSVSIVKSMNIILLYYLFMLLYRPGDSRYYFSFFVSGILSSTIVGTLKERIPRLLSMYNDLNYEWIDGERIIRFSGLFNDPNYFSVPIVLCLSVCLISLIQKKLKNKSLWIAVTAVLFLFGVLTVSKSFFLVLIAVLIVVLLGSNVVKNISRIIIVLALLVIFIYWNPGGIIDNILYRFNSGDLTTGRTEIWEGYIDIITENGKNLWFGLGLDAPYIQMPAHNMYIETVYYIGVIGFVLYGISLWISTFNSRRIFKRSILNFLGFAVILVQYFFLCGFMAYEFPFYLMIAYIMYQTDLKSGESILDSSKNVLL